MGDVGQLDNFNDSGGLKASIPIKFWLTLAAFLKADIFGLIAKFLSKLKFDDWLEIEYQVRSFT